MKIPLTQGKVAFVSDEEAHLANWKWHIADGYARRAFRPEKGVRRGMFLHHAIIGYPLNWFMVDHIDGDKLNNRRDNLRIVSRRENAYNSNRRRQGSTSSKYPGVTLVKNKWKAQIIVNYKTIYLGWYQSEEDAAYAYQEALEYI